jgi:hypothetical protein
MVADPLDYWETRQVCQCSARGVGNAASKGRPCGLPTLFGRAYFTVPDLLGIPRSLAQGHPTERLLLQPSPRNPVAFHGPDVVGVGPQFLGLLPSHPNAHLGGVFRVVHVPRRLANASQLPRGKIIAPRWLRGTVMTTR